MRVGCIGCLTVLVILLTLVVALLGILFLSVNLGDAPDFKAVPFSRGEGHLAQQKLLEIGLRQAGRSSRREPIILSEREVNAFLANHLAEAASLPLNPIAVRFLPGQMEITGRTPVKHLLQGIPFAQVLPYLPARTVDQPVWVTIRGRIAVDPAAAGAARTYGRFAIAGFSMGKQPVGSWILKAMLGPTHSVFRWEAPAIVERVEIEEGRAVIRTR